VDDGFAQMINNKLTILATQAIPVETLNEAEAKAELAEAEARQAPASGPERDRVRKDRERARAKVRLARRGAGRH